MIDLKDTNRVVEIFSEGHKSFPATFVKSIIEEMTEIGYELDEIGVQPIRGMSFTNIGQVPMQLGEVYGIYVKENDLQGITNQAEMSQDMFRTLSLIIQIKYA